jgi:hypothetical protein
LYLLKLRVSDSTLKKQLYYYTIFLYLIAAVLSQFTNNDWNCWSLINLIIYSIRLLIAYNNDIQTTLIQVVINLKSFLNYVDS